MVENIEKVSSMTMDIEQVEKDKLKSLFPQCFVEGKLDIDKLLALCGEYIDNDFEKYKFEWSGKSECYKIAGRRSTGTLIPCEKESVNFDTTGNLYIEGDNLEVLKLLQTAYFRKVKMIYIDPPYNTGNDFVYEDDFKDPIKKYKEVTSQTTKSNPETMGRFHTNWLNMMYPRLRLAANLLRDDGVIFISIDDNEVTNLKKICDEVFGEENFLAQITVQSNPRGRQSDKFVASVHDFLLIYAKNSADCVIGGAPLSDEQKSEFNLKDENGEYRLLGLRQRGSASRREDRPDMYFPIFVDKTSKEISLTDNGNSHAVLPRKSDGSDGRWMWGKEKCVNDKNRLVAKLIERRGEYDIFVKDYLNRGEGERTRKYKTIWSETSYNNQFGTQEVKAFLNGDFMSFPKSSDLLKDICRMGCTSSNNDIILDFFSGSATTAHAVMQLNAEDGCNRKFIMVQLPELCDEKAEYANICEIGKERIRRAGKKIAENNAEVDTGFKVLKLDSSNLAKWDNTPIENNDLGVLFERFDFITETIKKDRSDLDVVYEVMLKMGVSLDNKVSQVQFNDKKAYLVGEDSALLVCIDKGANGITPEDMEAMCKFNVRKIVASEEAFVDDTALSNAHYILKDRNIEMKLL